MQSDREIVDGILRGEESAFDCLFDRYRMMFRQFVAGMVRDENGAEDVVQDVFLRVWTKVEQWQEKGYVIPPSHIILCEATGFLTAQLLMSIDRIPQNDPNVVVWEPSVMYTEYYQGPFWGIKSQVDPLVDYVNNQKQKVAKLYTWVTNCPRCREKQGGPKTIILARVN